jgi:hypothetical protein
VQMTSGQGRVRAHWRYHQALLATLIVEFV